MNMSTPCREKRERERWTGVNMSTLLLSEGVPVIDADPMSFFFAEEVGGGGQTQSCLKFDPFIGSACCPPHSFRPGDLPSCFTLSVSSLRSSCPSCLDNQTNWFQSKQFSGPLNFFALFFQFKTTHPSERTCIKCPFTNVLVPAAFYQLIAHRLLTSMCVHFCLLCFEDGFISYSSHRLD